MVDEINGARKDKFLSLGESKAGNLLFMEEKEILEMSRDWHKDEYWLVSLSNGHTIKEPDLYDEGSNKSPWVRLMDFLATREDLYITNLRYCLRGRIYNLPSKSKKLFKFYKGNSDILKPKGYNFFTTSFSEMDTSTGAVGSCSAKRLEAYYDLFKLCLYIDTLSGESWITIEEVLDGDSSKIF